MTLTNTSQMRKRLISEAGSISSGEPGEIDLASQAMVAYSSEASAHPVEHLIDGHCGPDATRWASDRPDTTERIVFEFDRPQNITRLVYEAEECFEERTQEVRIEVSSDHGRTYRQVLAQGYNFSPAGATFQHEDLRFDLSEITHLRLTVVPNKIGSGVATLTCLRLFA
jgi:hypothetical protein